jgi:hypothetical protein
MIITEYQWLLMNINNLMNKNINEYLWIWIKVNEYGIKDKWI